MVLMVKNMAVSAGDERDLSLILGSEDPLQEGMATHCSGCLENSMDRGVWLAGYNPRSHKELDRNEAIEHNTAQSIILKKQTNKQTNKQPPT